MARAQPARWPAAEHLRRRRLVPAGEVLFSSPSALDCAPALQAAVDRLPLSGGRVYVAPGSYQLRSSLVLRDKHGVHLSGACRGQQGAHQGGTVLRCAAGSCLLLRPAAPDPAGQPQRATVSSLIANTQRPASPWAAAAPGPASRT